MLPSIAHIRIPVNQHHYPTLIIEYRVIARRVNSLLTVFVRTIEGGNHLRPIDIIIDVKNFMIWRELDNFSIGEELRKRRVKIIPLPLPPKIVDQQESAAQKVLPQIFKFCRVQNDAAALTYLEHVQKRIIENFWVVELEHNRLAHHANIR